MNFTVSKKTMENILLYKMLTVGDQKKILIDSCILKIDMPKNLALLMKS